MEGFGSRARMCWGAEVWGAGFLLVWGLPVPFVFVSTGFVWAVCSYLGVRVLKSPNLTKHIHIYIYMWNVHTPSWSLQLYRIEAPCDPEP